MRRACYQTSDIVNDPTISKLGHIDGPNIDIKRQLIIILITIRIFLV